MRTLKIGLSGPDVTALQQRLLELKLYAGPCSGAFDSASCDAVKAFQKSQSLTADGVVGLLTADALNLLPPLPLPRIRLSMVCKMFPDTPVSNVQSNLPPVLTELLKARIADKPMILMALGTIRAETASFLPVAEAISKDNSSLAPGSHPFDKYDFRAALGNLGPPDGERFRGRGFVQLTGRANYAFHGNAIGLGNQLIDNPDLAGDTDIAARLLASFLKHKEGDIRAALLANDLARARRLVNGGSHGLDAFCDAYHAGVQAIPDLQAAATT